MTVDRSVQSEVATTAAAGVPSTARARHGARSAGIAILATLVAAGCGGSSGAGSTKDVTDQTGVVSKVPTTVRRIAEGWKAHTIVDELLGVGGSLVAIPQHVKDDNPFLAKVDPHLAKVPELFTNTSVNTEDLLKLKPDVVFASTANAPPKQIRDSGLPTVVMSFTTFPQLMQTVNITAEALGGDAPKRAKAYNAYLQKQLTFVSSRTKPLTAAKRLSVVHVHTVAPLVVDGGGTMIDTWITLGGGTNAAASVKGNMRPVTLEQLLAWNPDVLILESPAPSLAEIARLPGWSRLKAVQDHRVFINPRGLYQWDRYTPEEALQVQWVASTLHPDLFRDVDFRAETKSFYKTFFGYEPTDADVDGILH
jgi:iron complex transport system substrate-binding protein